MRIDIWSDVVCPWCYIGKRRLEAALAAFPQREQVEVVYHSFELDPSAPQEGSESVAEALARKYGGGPANARQMMDQVAEVAAEAGLRFDYAHATHTRTVDAHRLLHLALAEGGPQLQGTLKERLLDAYFGHGRSMGDRVALREVAVAAGLDPSRVQEVLAGDEYAADVAADVSRARSYGVSGVPFFVFDDKYAVAGAQPTEVFTEVLDRVWQESQPALEVLSDGTVCRPDGCAV